MTGLTIIFYQAEIGGLPQDPGNVLQDAAQRSSASLTPSNKAKDRVYLRKSVSNLISATVREVILDPNSPAGRQSHPMKNPQLP